jgi:2-methylisocitrate lyase-like PEP mutase family enzyme
MRHWPQARVICNATDLPVSADLEKGFEGAPEIVAETIRLAAEAGFVGCSRGCERQSGRADLRARLRNGG